MVKQAKGKTNQLWRAHHMTAEALDEIKRIGLYYAEMDKDTRATKLAPHDPDEMLKELRQAYAALRPASVELTRIYHKYGGTI